MLVVIEEMAGSAAFEQALCLGNEEAGLRLEALWH